MNDPGKGGRGKQAPYSSTHYRIPEPIKPTVEKLATAYRFLVSSDFDHQGKGLLNRVDDAIAVSSYPSDEHDISSNGNPKPGTTNVKELDELKAKNTELQQKLEDMIALRDNQDEIDQLINSHQIINQSLIADIQKLESENLAIQAERDRLDQEVNELHARVGDLHLELTDCKFQLQAQPTRTIVPPAVIVLLRESLRLPANKGGAIKREIEKAMALLEMNLGNKT